MNSTKKILKAYMALEDITQQELASVLGITQATLSKKINGLVEFSDKEKIVIADLFNADIRIFFTHKVNVMNTKVNTPV